MSQTSQPNQAGKLIRYLGTDGKYVYLSLTADNLIAARTLVGGNYDVIVGFLITPENGGEPVYHPSLPSTSPTDHAEPEDVEVPSIDLSSEDDEEADDQPDLDEEFGTDDEQ